MFLAQNGTRPAVGRTVTYTSLPCHPTTTQAVIVELRPPLAELDNGALVPLQDLRLVVTDERWLPIQDFADQYLLSSYGKVVSLSYRHTDRQRLLQASGPQRYPSVSLYGAAGVTQVGLNRLVAQHFLPPPAEERFQHVIPKDGNHLNLRAENLQWVDQREQQDRVVLERFHRCGARNPNSKLTPDSVRQIRALAAQGQSYQQLAMQFGVSRPTISLLVRRLTWRTI
ncbi:NUMOD4 domain-containing protein [Hymenobacter aerilatus]|uniref:NUMOD4 domain-containing protein n=1 Tax=Hymenobacter aerilatus TaxID=2932251 RepID=A0A8T9T304_9BACT|nr:helix-turn-helix domain-containing protein [Hymenobacter aerilatus]UOR06960.1 NUMOD4 domain-containing protein [Hymenobacter aerilatus]